MMTNPRPTAESLIGGAGFLLDRVAHSLSLAFAEALAPAELTPTTLGLLSALARWSPMTQTELARFLGIERQQAMHLVDDLARRGLVERHARDSDRRVWDVVLTDRGTTARARARRLVTGHYGKLFATLEPHEISQLTDLLLRLAPNGRYPDVLAPPSRD